MRLLKIVFLTMICTVCLAACGGQDQKIEKKEQGDSLNGAEDFTAAAYVTDNTSSDAIEESTVSIGLPDTKTIRMKPMFNLYVNDKYTPVLGVRFKRLQEDGLNSAENLDKTVLKAGEIKKDITVSSGDAAMTVAAINPYENEASLSDCIICGLNCDDRSGIFSVDGDHHSCGKASYDDLTFGDVYEQTDNKLVYKFWSMIPVDVDVTFEKDPKGDKVIKPSGDAQLTLDFENNLLTHFSMVLPEIYYEGMQDNMDEDTISTIDDESLEAAKKTRNDILSELKAAFKKADLDVDINDETGEIVMGNDILFKKNSYELSDDGKDYLDRFMEVYASVVFGKKYSDSIKEIRFEGHTDSSGEAAYNKELSENRAGAIMNYCLESDKNHMTSDQKKQLKKTASSVGYASANLIFDENGKEDPDKSRRAAIKFFVNVE